MTTDYIVRITFKSPATDNFVKSLNIIIKKYTFAYTDIDGLE